MKIREQIFVTVANGKDYIETYFPSFYQSISSSYEKDDYIIYVATNFPDHDYFKRKNVRIISFENVSNYKDYTKNASQKTFYYREVFEQLYDTFENCNACFLDVDTCVIRNIKNYFMFDFDIGYTFYLNHMTPYGDTTYTKSNFNRLNSGVVLVKINKASRNFMNQWHELTNNFILNGSPLNKEFMGEDQDSIAYMVGTKKLGDSLFFLPSFGSLNIVDIFGQKVKILGFTCRELNEPESTASINNDCHIIHYKGGWRNILPEPSWSLVEDSPRKKENSIAQYNVWKNYRKDFLC